MLRASVAAMQLYSASRRWLGLSVVVGWGRTLLGAGAVLTVAGIVDRVASDQPVGTGMFLLLGGFLLARAFLAALAPPAATATATRVESDLRRRILDAAVRVGPWSGKRTGETVLKATEGVSAVGALAGTFLPQLIGGMSTPILLAVVVAIVDLPTALVLILLLPTIPVLLRLLEKRFASVSARYRETADVLAARFLDGIQGMRTLKAFDVSGDYGDRLAADSERLRTETMRLLRVNQLALLAVDTLFTLGTVVAAAAMAAYRLSVGAVSLGGAVAIVLLGVMLVEPLTQIGRFFYVGAIGRAAAAQVKEFFEMAEGAPEEAVGVGVDGSPGTVELIEVGFDFPDGTRALDQVSFRVEAGEKVALVGPSGAGKTTIAHLVLGLLQPTRGTVRVEGQPTLVPQRPVLFRGTVRDNLHLAMPTATDDDLWRALEGADLAALVSRLPQGMETQVGERGLLLSGGEAQRLAIARTLLADAPVVVLDEPTSNIDLESESRVKAALDRLTVGRTVLIIAHRRSTIAGVDRVLLLEDGRLTELEQSESVLFTSGGGPS